MAPVPPALKGIQALLQRANEVKSRDPAVAYWCKYYAVQQGIAAKDPESKAFVASLLNELEATRTALAGNDAVTSDLAGQAAVENFALGVFRRADEQDRSGAATINTGRTYFAATQFFSVLGAFGSVPPEMASKAKYAKWRAAVILAACAAGETPPPPPADESTPGADAGGDLGDGGMDADADELASASPSVAAATAASSSTASPARSPSPQLPARSAAPPVKSDAMQRPVIVGSAPTNVSGASRTAPQAAGRFDPAVLDAAQKHARYVISALQYDDVKTAVANLEQALQLLRPLCDRG